MIVPIEWLQEYLELSSMKAEDIAEKFTYIGYMLDRPIQSVNEFTVLDLEVRQNRSDCLSLIGLARELGAVINQHAKVPETTDFSQIQSENINITIEDENLCYRFNTITIQNIKNGSSPDWMKARLEAYGIKSINALVDITNYVMVEYGQPLHAFDAQKLPEKQLVIRPARNNEKIGLLGEKSIALSDDDLVIADSSGPIAIAGIMGGKETCIDENTTQIILEAATYNQANIRRSTIRHDIRTEASTRLEKFLHPFLTELALARAAYLIKEITGGDIIDHTDAYPHKFKNTEIELRFAQVKRLTGIELSKETIIDLLNKLEITTEPLTDVAITCSIPYFRTDLEQEADLIEEIIRIYGYDQIPMTPLDGGVPRDIQSRSFVQEEEIRDLLVGMGYDETITEPLVSHNNSQLDPVMLENSLTSDKTMLRTSLEQSLVHTMNEHKKHNFNVIKLFELGKIYFMSENTFKEEKHCGLIYHNEIDFDFKIAKGDIELLLDRLGYTLDEAHVSIQLIDAITVYIDINVESLLKQQRVSKEIVLTSPLQNVITEDFSFIMKRNISVSHIISSIKSIHEYVYDVTMQAESQMMDDGSIKTLATVTFYSPDISLSKKDIEPLRIKIQTLLSSN